MQRSLSIEFRGAIVQVNYRPIADDDVIWEFAEERLNRLVLTGRERQDIRLEALGDYRRG